MRINKELFFLPSEDLDSIVNLVGHNWDHLRNSNLLLTGGTGFIGKWLLASFLHANRSLGLGSRITIVSRNPQKFLDEFPCLKGAKEVSWIAGDVRELNFGDSEKYQFIIHGATDISITSSGNEILDVCTRGTSNVLKSTRQSRGANHFLLISSGAVYGRIPSDINAVGEEYMGAPDSLSPSSAYGEAKRISELLTVMEAEKQGSLKISIARCFSFIGPYLPLDKHFAIGNFINAAINDRDINISGDGTPLRSYLYISDLIHWLWILLFQGSSGRAYNIGGDECLSIGELASRVNVILNGRGMVKIAIAPRPNVATQSYIPCIERISNDFSLKPKINLDEAIIRTAEWIRERGYGK